jgi:hypothetical protein
MKAALFFIIVAMMTGLFFIGFGQRGSSFEKSEHLKSTSNLRFEKPQRFSVFGASFSQEKISDVSDMFRGFSEKLEQTAWVKWCKEEPVISGLLLMVIGVGICLLGFIFHIIRTDTRFL